jgi:hypothetical protein
MIARIDGMAGVPLGEILPSAWRLLDLLRADHEQSEIWVAIATFTLGGEVPIVEFHTSHPEYERSKTLKVCSNSAAALANGTGARTEVREFRATIQDWPIRRS